VLELRDNEAGNFCTIVPAPKADGVECEWTIDEIRQVLALERSSLEREALARCRRQRVQILGIGGAQVSLCVDVQSNGFGHFRAEEATEPSLAHHFMQAVDATVRERLGTPGQQVPHVVEQRRDHERLWRA